MPRTVAIGVQDFSVIREKNYFYIDKTSFIKEWWEGENNVTLITRPRRFGKTLMMSTNSWMERGILTGITRISRESVFSDLNHLEVISATSAKYAAMFGFTQEEVFAALDEFGLKSRREVKEWYDGFTFGEREDIYNPWSIINFLDKRKLASYWANTSSNGLVSKLIREANKNIKLEFERLMQGGHLLASLDEQIVYDQLEDNDEAIWSLLLACGYLKVVHGTTAKEGEDTSCLEQGYELALTNYEVKRMFSGLIRGWFGKVSYDYNDFVKALLTGDIKAMNAYMNRITMTMFSFFDTGNRPSGAEPERFYHGFVLGLLVELENRYRISSNRESGFGRYDVMMEPYSDEDWAIILEFKVHDPKKEDGLEDTIKAALLQIEVKKYEAEFMARGIKKERVRKYGFAFAGKAVLIGEG